jgi:hypothetical protein
MAESVFVAIDREGLSPEEVEVAIFIEENILALHSSADNFRYTVDLYMHLRTLPRDRSDWRWNAWAEMAARNGAIEANGCGAALEAINKAKAPAIWAKVDMAERSAATKLFAAEFPRIEAVRHSAAHPGELSKDAIELGRHRVTKPFRAIGIQNENGTIFVSGSVNTLEDKILYGATFKGEPVEYELSYAKADALDRVVRHYRDAFAPIDKFRRGPPTSL